MIRHCEHCTTLSDVQAAAQHSVLSVVARDAQDAARHSVLSVVARDAQDGIVVQH